MGFLNFAMLLFASSIAIETLDEDEFNKIAPEYYLSYLGTLSENQEMQEASLNSIYTMILGDVKRTALSVSLLLQNQIYTSHQFMNNLTSISFNYGKNASPKIKRCIDNYLGYFKVTSNLAFLEVSSCIGNNSLTQRTEKLIKKGSVITANLTNHLISMTETLANCVNASIELQPFCWTHSLMMTKNVIIHDVLLVLAYKADALRFHDQMHETVKQCWSPAVTTLAEKVILTEQVQTFCAQNKYYSFLNKSIGSSESEHDHSRPKHLKGITAY